MGSRNKQSKVSCMAKFFIIVLILLLFSFLGMLIVNAIYGNIIDARNDITTMEYRTDIEPLHRRFARFDNSHETFWKAGRYNGGFLPPGPTDIWLRGFIILNPTDFYALKLEGNWTRTELVFEEGMDPSVTGLDHFDWHSSREMSQTILRESRYRGFYYLGSFYLDKANEILYFYIATF